MASSSGSSRRPTQGSASASSSPAHRSPLRPRTAEKVEHGDRGAGRSQGLARAEAPVQVVDEDLGGERGVDQTEAHAGGPADVHPHELIAVDGVEGAQAEAHPAEPEPDESQRRREHRLGRGFRDGEPDFPEDLAQLLEAEVVLARAQELLEGTTAELDAFRRRDGRGRLQVGAAGLAAAPRVGQRVAEISLEPSGHRVRPRARRHRATEEGRRPIERQRPAGLPRGQPIIAPGARGLVPAGEMVGQHLRVGQALRLQRLGQATVVIAQGRPRQPIHQGLADLVVIDLDLVPDPRSAAADQVFAAQQW